MLGMQAQRVCWDLLGLRCTFASMPLIIRCVGLCLGVCLLGLGLLSCNYCRALAVAIFVGRPCLDDAQIRWFLEGNCESWLTYRCCSSSCSSTARGGKQGGLRV